MADTCIRFAERRKCRKQWTAPDKSFLCIPGMSFSKYGVMGNSQRVLVTHFRRLKRHLAGCCLQSRVFGKVPVPPSSGKEVTYNPVFAGNRNKQANTGVYETEDNRWIMHSSVSILWKKQSPAAIHWGPSATICSLLKNVWRTR